MEKQLKLMNISDGLVVLNYGSSHYELQPGDITPGISVPEANSYLLRNAAALRVYDEEESMLQEPKSLETFPSHTDGVDDPDRDEAPESPQDETSPPDADEDPEDNQIVKPAPAKPAKSGKRKR